jgi:hypothetical protein
MSLVILWPVTVMTQIIDTSSSKGFVFRLFLAYQDSAFGAVDMTEVLNKVNDIMAEASNIHIQVVKLQSMIQTCNDDSDRIKIKEILKTSLCPAVYVCNGNPTGEDNSLIYFIDDSNGRHAIVPLANSVNILAKRIANAIFKSLTGGHYKGSNCICPDDVHRPCLSDIDIKKRYDPLSQSASSCWNLHFLDNLKIDPVVKECFTAGELSQSKSVKSIALNGVIEDEEECDCFFKDTACRSVCYIKRLPTQSTISTTRLPTVVISSTKLTDSRETVLTEEIPTVTTTYSATDPIEPDSSEATLHDTETTPDEIDSALIFEVKKDQGKPALIVGFALIIIAAIAIVGSIFFFIKRKKDSTNRPVKDKRSLISTADKSGFKESSLSRNEGNTMTSIIASF